MNDLVFKGRPVLMISISVVLFVGLTIWWFLLHPFSADESLVYSKYIWGACYQLIALWGCICGLIIAHSWGGLRSFLGKSITFFSLGLLFQAFGQTVYSYFNLIADIQAPYPSIGDIGFFGSIIFYVVGVVYLGKVIGMHLSLNSFKTRFQAFAIPVIILLSSYFFFLRGYEFDWSDKLRVLLDFGYPFGQAVYVALAILTLSVSKKMLGGIMRWPIILFLISLILQYISDFNFLYTASAGTWLVGGYGDFLYMVSYFLMTISVIQVGGALRKIRETV